MKTKTPIQKAVALVGTQKGLADALSSVRLKRIDGKVLRFRQSHVWDWLDRGYPPAEVCVAIESITEGRVTRESLRPDIFSPKVA